MKLRLALAGFCALALAVAGLSTTAQAAPSFGLQLPWPSGTQHQIIGPGGGQSYNCGYHTGIDQYAIDFAFARDDPVTATAAGTVAAFGNTGDGYGIKVVIDHGYGYTSLYAHLDFVDAAINLGVTVIQGQIVGYADNTGTSFGDHLHFRMTKSGAAYVPEPMSGVLGFGQYGVCTGVTSPLWTSRPPFDAQQVSDTTGDAADKNDAVVFFASTGNWKVAPSNGSAFTNAKTWITGHGYTSSRELTGDVNGDGKADAVVYFGSNGSWYVALSTGSKFAAYTQWTIGHGVGSSNQFLGDVTGDGKADAIVFFRQTGDWYVARAKSTGDGFLPYDPTPWISGHGTGSTTQMMGDVTGGTPSRADAIVYFESIGGQNAVWYVARSNGSSFDPYSQWIAGHGFTSDRQMVADTSGDGRADAVVYFGANGDWYVATSNGSSFNPYTQWTTGHGAGSTNQMLGDTTGDGKADAVVYFGNGY